MFTCCSDILCLQQGLAYAMASGYLRLCIPNPECPVFKTIVWLQVWLCQGWLNEYQEFLGT